MSLDTFERLVNPHGLVPMRIERDDFAPYRKGSIAGFPPDTALRIYERGAAVPIAADGSAIPVPGDAAPAPEPEPAVTVEIPPDWRDLHHLQRIRLAREVSGLSDDTVKMTVPEADTILAAVMERRSKSHGNDPHEE